MFIGFLRTFADLLFQILIFAIIARALLSWFPVRPGNPFYALMVVLLQITEPILAPLRRVVPMIGMIDITPLIAMLLLGFAQRMVDTALLSASRGF
jgi:YggT family protein